MLTLGLCWLSACQDVVEVDIPSTAQELVVEGSLSDQEPAQVSLSTTAPYLGGEETPKIRGAQISLYQNDSLLEFLTEVDSLPGVYRGSVLGQLNQSYHLKITVSDNYPEQVKGNWYSQPSLLRPVAQIDSLSIQKLDRSTVPNVLDPGDYALLYFQERPGRGDYTRVQRWLNDSLFRREVIIIEDEGIDGFYFGRDFPPLAIFGPFNPADTLDQGQIKFRIRFESISAEHADYLRLINEQTQVGSPFDAPPALIVGNIRLAADSSRYAFGYFRASARSEAHVRYDP